MQKKKDRKRGIKKTRGRKKQKKPVIRKIAKVHGPK